MDAFTIGLALALFLGRKINFTITTVDSVPVQLNLSGAIIPVIMSTILFLAMPSNTYLALLIATITSTFLAYELSKVTRKGIVLPVHTYCLVTFIIVFAIVDYLKLFDYLSHILFISSTYGTLIGADLLKLKKAKIVAAKTGKQVTIGGAGTVDAIIVSALVAISYATLVSNLLG